VKWPGGEATRTDVHRLALGWGRGDGPLPLMVRPWRERPGLYPKRIGGGEARPTRNEGMAGPACRRRTEHVTCMIGQQSVSEFVQPREVGRARDGLLSRWSIGRLRSGRGPRCGRGIGISGQPARHHWMLGMFAPRGAGMRCGRRTPKREIPLPLYLPWPGGARKGSMAAIGWSGHWPVFVGA